MRLTDFLCSKIFRKSCIILFMILCIVSEKNQMEWNLSFDTMGHQTHCCIHTLDLCSIYVENK